jgi:phosphatidylserine decarboxylase
MGIYTVVLIVNICILIVCSVYLYWRYVWFFRNPPRLSPPGDSILSPADGTVVYVKQVQPHEAVLNIKKGVVARLEDIAPTDLEGPKLVIGIFMSPFDVHYNRAPMSGMVEWVRHYPAKGRNLHMTSMHWRTVFRMPPYFAGSLHVVQNERTVTKFRGVFKEGSVSCYVVQIAGGSVRGIESFIPEGAEVGRSETFGMIRIGSQVDLVLPWVPGMEVLVRAGDKVRAGETILVE